MCFAVIRAKAVSEKEVDSGNDIYGNPIKRIQYEIKQIKVTLPGGVVSWTDFGQSLSLLNSILQATQQKRKIVRL